MVSCVTGHRRQARGAVSGPLGSAPPAAAESEFLSLGNTMTTLTIDLPDNLPKEAQDAGLLGPSAIETLLRENLRRRVVDGLFSAADKLADANFPPTTLEEIQREVNAVRAQRVNRAPGA